MSNEPWPVDCSACKDVLDECPESDELFRKIQHYHYHATATPTQTPEDAGELREKISIAYLANHPGTYPAPKAFIDDCMMFIAAEQTKLLEDIDGEAQNMDWHKDIGDIIGHTDHPDMDEFQKGYNKAMRTVRTLLAKHKEGLK